MLNSTYRAWCVDGAFLFFLVITSHNDQIIPYLFRVCARLPVHCRQSSFDVFGLTNIRHIILSPLRSSTSHARLECHYALYFKDVVGYQSMHA